jgi:hypothetical protein
MASTMAQEIRRDWRIVSLLFVMLLTSYAYIFPRWAEWNQNSRLDLVMAIVDQGTLAIDDYYENTGDYAVYNGHQYSTKAPGSAFLGVPVYWLYRQLMHSTVAEMLVSSLGTRAAVAETLTPGGTGILPEKLYVALALYAVTFWVVSVPSAFLGVVLYLFSGHLTRVKRYRIWVALTYGLATIAFPYSGSYFGHQIVAVLLFTSFYLLFLLAQNGRTCLWRQVLIGFLLSYAIITEYPVGLIAVGLFFYALFRLPNKVSTATTLIAGGLPPVIAWMAHNYAIFGRLVAFGYLYTPLYQDKNNVGFFSLTYPQLDALWGITFSPYRGLFFLSPVLLLALPGFYYFVKRKAWRAEAIVCLYATVSFLLFNGSSVMWEGGHAVGPRYVLPMLPFMSFSLIWVIERWKQSIWPKLIAGTLTLWSMFAVWAESIGGQSFPGWNLRPLFTYSVPRLWAGDVARNWGMVVGLPGVLSLLPLVLVLGGLLWQLWRSTDSGQSYEYDQDGGI